MERRDYGRDIKHKFVKRLVRRKHFRGDDLDLSFRVFYMSLKSMVSFPQLVPTVSNIGF